MLRGIIERHLCNIDKEDEEGIKSVVLNLKVLKRIRNTRKNKMVDVTFCNMWEIYMKFGIILFNTGFTKM